MLKQVTLALTTGILAGWAGPSVAGVHPPEVEASLNRFVQDWTIEGMEEAFRETCEWYHDRSFVVCNTTEIENGKPSHSVSIIGWSSQTRAYTYHHYGDNGRSRSETGYPTADDGIVYLGERHTPSGFAQYRSTISPLPGGSSFSFDQLRSVNGGPWEPTVKFNYVPRKPR